MPVHLALAELPLVRVPVRELEPAMPVLEAGPPFALVAAAVAVLAPAAARHFAVLELSDVHSAVAHLTPCTVPAPTHERALIDRVAKERIAERARAQRPALPTQALPLPVNGLSPRSQGERISTRSTPRRITPHVRARLGAGGRAG